MAITISGLSMANYGLAQTTSTGTSSLEQIQNQLNQIQETFLGLRDQVSEFLNMQSEKDVFLFPNSPTDVTAPGLSSISVTQLLNGDAEVYVRDGLVTSIDTANKIVYVKVFGLTGKAEIMPDSKILNQNWLSISLSNFATGDQVNIYGIQDPNVPGAVRVRTIRNLTLTPQTICIQVPTRAVNPSTGECVEFENPCVVPRGWTTGCSTATTTTTTPNTSTTTTSTPSANTTTTSTPMTSTTTTSTPVTGATTTSTPMTGTTTASTTASTSTGTTSTSTP